MRLDSFKQKARLSAASAIDQFRTLFARQGDRAAVTQQLDLSELEDRILLSASPAAVMVESAPASGSVQVGAPLESGTDSLFAATQTAVPTESPAQEDHAALPDAFLLDAAPLDDVATSIDSKLDQSEFDQSELKSPTERAATEVIFIDESAADFEQLVADLETQREAGRAIDYFVLDSEQDGIDQIAETLQRYSDLDAVHLVSHGTAGAVKLGAT